MKKLYETPVIEILQPMQEEQLALIINPSAIASSDESGWSEWE